MPQELSTWASKPKVATTSTNRLFGWDFTGIFPGQTLAASPAPTVVCTAAAMQAGYSGTPTTADIVPASVAVNVADFDDDDGGAVVTGHGVRARLNCSSAVHGANYTFRVLGTTAGSETDGFYCTLQVRNT